MIIAIDGACKRNGKPDCISSGVAAIFHDDYRLELRTRFETESTNQRGEINGLIEALQYARLVIAEENNAAENDYDVVIISDSQYLCDTITKDWISKWARQNWEGSTGPIKNPDLWKRIYEILLDIRACGGDVYMNWTKGHLLAYSEKNIREALTEDSEGYVLLDRITTIANRPSEYMRIVDAFNNHRREQDYPELPESLAIEWVIYNTIADCVASYTVKRLDEMLNLVDEAE